MRKAWVSGNDIFHPAGRLDVDMSVFDGYAVCLQLNNKTA
jgi:hypothetical protein